MSLRVVSGRRLLLGIAVVALAASPSFAQRTGTGTGTTTGALSNLSSTQLLAALSALQKLSTDSGVSLQTLANAAGVTLPAGVGGGATGGSTTPPSLTADQLATVQADIQALSTATGVPVSQLSAIATAAGIPTTTPGGNGGNTNSGGNTNGGNTNNGGTPGGGAGTTTPPTTTPTAAPESQASPFDAIPRPMLFGERMPLDVQEVLIGWSLWTMQYLYDEYGYKPATQAEWLQGFTHIFDTYALQHWPTGYTAPGVTYWILRGQALVE